MHGTARLEIVSKTLSVRSLIHTEGVAEGPVAFTATGRGVSAQNQPILVTLCRIDWTE